MSAGSGRSRGVTDRAGLPLRKGSPRSEGGAVGRDCGRSRGALPALIDEEAAAISARVGPACEEPAREVRRAVADLGALLKRLAQADWDTALHPKLEQISRTTLPAFVRALESCLARPLPEDPHEFYGASAALLKCSISALRGQGRYLRSVLPDEMKAVKAGVDVVGHAVNAMTAALGEEKRGPRGPGDSSPPARANGRARVRGTGCGPEVGRCCGRGLAALTCEREGAEAELVALNGSPAALDLEERRAEAGRLRARASVIEAAHRVQAEGLIRILRRAERLVAKRGDRQTATRLHHLQSTLAEPLPADGSALAPLLAEASPWSATWSRRARSRRRRATRSSTTPPRSPPRWAPAPMTMPG